jgi:uncharacterized RDD family membrane protein YckC
MSSASSESDHDFQTETRLAAPAGFVSRFLAFLIDLFALAGLALLLNATFQLVTSFFVLRSLGLLRLGVAQAALRVVIVAVIGLYFPIAWTIYGRSFGQALFGLRVVTRKDGKRPSLACSFVRLAALWVSALPLFLGFLWILGPGHEGWHDRLAGTRVLYDDDRPRR